MSSRCISWLYITANLACSYNRITEALASDNGVCMQLERTDGRRVCSSRQGMAEVPRSPGLPTLPYALLPAHRGRQREGLWVLASLIRHDHIQQEHACMLHAPLASSHSLKGFSYHLSAALSKTLTINRISAWQSLYKDCTSLAL